VSHNSKNVEGQVKTIEVVASEVKEESVKEKPVKKIDPLMEKLRDVEFLKFVMTKYPKVSNHVGYCLTPDKATGERIGDMLLREFMGGKIESEAPKSKVYSYIQNGSLIEYSEMDWQNDLLPGEFDRWCNRLRGANSDDRFIEDNSIGYSRNIRIGFCRWYENFYIPQQESKNEEDLPPVNQRALSTFRELLQRFGSTRQSFA
jgi:hypothetical protein